jgi:hypothetical protein
MKVRNDFRIIFTNKEDGSVSFESLNFSQATTGPDFVCQKVLNSLLCSVGDLPHYPQWGAGLLEVFKMKISAKDSAYKSFIVGVLRKAMDDVRSTQGEDLTPDSRLSELKLLSVQRRVSDQSLEVKISVILESGAEAEIVL